ncbi:MAG: hypothetical protein K2N87_03645 [Eubacterium sp.]|nr:hypothetical protein [Eubacterium sp.]
MKRDMISRMIGGIDQQFIQEAEDYLEAVGNPAGGRRFRCAGAIHKKIIAAAAVFVCIIVGCLPSAARSLQGYFHDIVRWDGAVTGTEYEAAEQEVKICVSEMIQEKEKLLPVHITFSDMTKAPYSDLSAGEVALGDYRILDVFDHVIMSAEGLQEEIIGKVQDGKVTVMLPFSKEAVAAGSEYRLVIEGIYGIKKADQPLRIRGCWECKFMVE